MSLNEWSGVWKITKCQIFYNYPEHRCNEFFGSKWLRWTWHYHNASCSAYTDFRRHPNEKQVDVVKEIDFAKDWNAFSNYSTSVIKRSLFYDETKLRWKPSNKNTNPYIDHKVNVKKKNKWQRNEAPECPIDNNGVLCHWQVEDAIRFRTPH